MSTKIYGIKNCDTMKKAFKWLDERGVDYEFIDFKKTPPELAQVKVWLLTLGADEVINKRGTTYRQLPDATKENMNDAIATQVILDNPSIVKRPLLQLDDGFHVGFKPEQYEALFL